MALVLSRLPAVGGIISTVPKPSTNGQIRHLGQLRQDPANRRKRTQANLGMIADSLQQVGAARSIVIDEDNVILAGNGVWEAAGQVGIERVRVVDADGEEVIAVRRTGLTDQQKRRLGLYDNQAALLAEWDVDQLLRDVELGLDFDGIFAKDELDALLRQVSGNGLQPGVDPDAVPPSAPARCKRGEVWELGRHRLAVGDCTDVSILEAVMARERAAVCITSPPYNLGNDHHTADRRTQAYQDDHEEEEYQKEQAVLLELVADVTTGDCFYQHKNRIKKGRHLSPLAWVERGTWRMVQEIVWINGGPNMDPCRFYPQTERVFWLTRQGSDTRLENRESLTDWWHVAPVGAAEPHTRQFPVEIPRRLLAASGAESVIDPYAGSGTTIIAAESLGRRCYGMEIEPRYCDIALLRWEQATGQTARRVE